MKMKKEEKMIMMKLLFRCTQEKKKENNLPHLLSQTKSLYVWLVQASRLWIISHRQLNSIELADRRKASGW